jgi:hypothetical protein
MCQQQTFADAANRKAALRRRLALTHREAYAVAAAAFRFLRHQPSSPAQQSLPRAGLCSPPAQEINKN